MLFPQWLILAVPCRRKERGGLGPSQLFRFSREGRHGRVRAFARGEMKRTLFSLLQRRRNTFLQAEHVAENTVATLLLVLAGRRPSAGGKTQLAQPRVDRLVGHQCWFHGNGHLPLFLLYSVHLQRNHYRDPNRGYLLLIFFTSATSVKVAAIGLWSETPSWPAFFGISSSITSRLIVKRFEVSIETMKLS